VDVEKPREYGASAPTARQLAYKFRPAHIHAVERAVAEAGGALDLMLGRDPGEDVTFDLDGTDSAVNGARKQATGRSSHGNLGYTSFAVTWAERGAPRPRGSRAQTTPGSRRPSPTGCSATHSGFCPRRGQITVRGDVGFYSADLMVGCRKRRMHLTFSAPRTSVMWSKARRDPR